MRRFILTLFVLSLIASAGAYYWREYLPEKIVVITSLEKRSLSSEGDSSESRQSTQSIQPIERKQPSQRQDLAVTISILSSIISAIAAVVQTMLAARAVRS